MNEPVTAKGTGFRPFSTRAVDSGVWFSEGLERGAPGLQTDGSGLPCCKLGPMVTGPETHFFPTPSLLTLLQILGSPDSSSPPYAKQPPEWEG